MVREFIVREETVEMTWPCSSCAHVNQGRLIRCEACGNPKEPDESYHDPGTTAPVTDPKLLALAAAPAHTLCPYCNSQQRTSKDPTRCAECGAALKKTGGTTERLGRLPVPRHSAASSLPSVVSPSVTAEYLPFDSIASNTGWRSLLPQFLWPHGAIGTGCITLILVAIWFFSPHKTNIAVQGIAWARSIEVQQVRVEHFSDWGQPPSDASNVVCQNQIRSHRQCNPYQCGVKTESYTCGTETYNCRTVTTSKGNGFGSRTTRCSERDKVCTRNVPRTCYQSCPVYDTRCGYDAPRWHHLTTLHTSGTDHNVTWPTYNLIGPTQRLGTSTENYQVTFRSGSGNKLLSYTATDAAEFNKYTPGDTWLANVNYAGQVWPIQKSPVK